MPEKNTDTTVEEFNIQKEKLDVVHEILSSKTTWYKKKDQLLALAIDINLKIKPLCCVCYNAPKDNVLENNTMYNVNTLPAN